MSLNINGLNSPNKKTQAKIMYAKTESINLLYTKNTPENKDRHYLRVKAWKTGFHANSLKKQAGVAMLISNKIHFQPKLIKKRWLRTLDTYQRKNPPR
jgi:exonuclease III